MAKQSQMNANQVTADFGLVDGQVVDDQFAAVSCRVSLHRTPYIFDYLYVDWNCSFIYQVALARRHGRIFRSTSQAATCAPVYHSRRRPHTVPLRFWTSSREMVITILMWPNRESNLIYRFSSRLFFTWPLIDTIETCSNRRGWV